MTSRLELVRPPRAMRERVIVALDVDNLDKVKEVVGMLAHEVGMFKIGKQLFTHAGPQAVKLVQELGGEGFLDLKFHDFHLTALDVFLLDTAHQQSNINPSPSFILDMMVAT